MSDTGGPNGVFLFRGSRAAVLKSCPCTQQEAELVEGLVSKHSDHRLEGSLTLSKCCFPHLRVSSSIRGPTSPQARLGTGRDSQSFYRPKQEFRSYCPGRSHSNCPDSHYGDQQGQLTPIMCPCHSVTHVNCTPFKNVGPK